MSQQNIDPKEDLLAIRNMMERSSKFLSLSGLSGIVAGMCALVGAAVAYFLILDSGQVQYDEYLRGLGNTSTSSVRLLLAIDALAVLIVASFSAFYFSMLKSKKANQPLWTNSTRRLLGHLLIPLVTGGVFAIILVTRNNIQLVASVTLIFYGLSLVNAGKFTLGEIHYLGLTEIVLGILAGIFVNHGLLFWAVGFGVVHIVYGIVMYFRYDR
jgi:hypothetical protein